MRDYTQPVYVSLADRRPGPTSCLGRCRACVTVDGDRSARHVAHLDHPCTTSTRIRKRSKATRASPLEVPYMGGRQQARPRGAVAAGAARRSIRRRSVREHVDQRRAAVDRQIAAGRLFAAAQADAVSEIRLAADRRRAAAAAMCWAIIASWKLRNDQPLQMQAGRSRRTTVVRVQLENVTPLARVHVLRHAIRAGLFGAYGDVGEHRVRPSRYSSRRRRPNRNMSPAAISATNIATSSIASSPTSIPATCSNGRACC